MNDLEYPTGVEESNAGDNSIVAKNAKRYSTEEFETGTFSTDATIHIVDSKKTFRKEPQSARVHIQTPNPSINHVDELLSPANHICCVVDISGSMGIQATSKDESGNAVEDNGLTILDVVKFATLVIAESLNSQDKLSIITYSDEANVALRPTNMTMNGKKYHCANVFNASFKR